MKALIRTVSAKVELLKKIKWLCFSNFVLSSHFFRFPVKVSKASAFTAGNVHDSRYLAPLLSGKESAVYADSAYKSAKHDALLGNGNEELHFRKNLPQHAIDRSRKENRAMLFSKNSTFAETVLIKAVMQRSLMRESKGKYS